MVSHVALVVSLLTTADTIYGGTALDSKSSASMSSWWSPPPVSTADQRPLALSFTFMSYAQSE
jgi:hypothetical protein